MPQAVRADNRYEGRSRGAEKRSELVCRVKYNNTLPDIPFDPKFIVYPFESNRYVPYNATSLERDYKFELLTEHDLGVSIDLINPDAYRPVPDSYIDPEDEYLLEDESNPAVDSKRSRHHNKSVSWLRKTEYISTEYNRFTQSSQKAEARLGYSIKKQLKDDVLYKDRDSQIKAIKDTFELAKQPIENHYSKPGVKAVEVLPVYPDFEMWRQPCAQVIFDSDPAQKGKPVQEQLEEMSKAMIRGMVDEHGEQFVAYFLPTGETIDKQRRDAELGLEYDDNELYEYVLCGEYNWNVKNKASRGYEENYFFVMKDNGIFYNELETRVRLSKRRKVGGGQSSTAKSRLVVTHRPLTDQELAAQDARLMMLEPQGIDEDLLNKSDYEDDEDAHSRGNSPQTGSPAHSSGAESPQAASPTHSSGAESPQAASPAHSSGADSPQAASPAHSSGAESPQAASPAHSSGAESPQAASPAHSSGAESSEAASPAHSSGAESPQHQLFETSP